MRGLASIIDRETSMKNIVTAFAATITLAVSALALPVQAADEAASGASGASAPKRQTRMGQCSKEATGKKGDERKAFMKQCLSSGKADKVAGGAAPADAANDKAKLCKGEAKGMRGNARKDFLAECMTRAA
jgi:hypothetical protein